VLLTAQQPGGGDPVVENLFPPELVMSHQKAIGLDDAQKNYIRGELLKTQSRFTELQWRLQDDMEALLSLLKQTPVDESQVMNRLDKVLTSEREIKRTQISLLVRIKNKLTPEQQSRLQKLRSESFSHFPRDY
jgi:Spy/CpxP family protein refolding chaperone